MKQNQLAAAVIIVILGVMGGYYLGYRQVDEAAAQMFREATIVSTKVENVTLLPFSADLRVTYSVRNPTDTRIILNMDADLYHGDVYVGHVTSSEQTINPLTRSDVIVKTNIKGDIVKAIQQGTGKSWQIKGTMKFTGYLLGVIPVTSTKTGILSD